MRLFFLFLLLLASVHHSIADHFTDKKTKTDPTSQVMSSIKIPENTFLSSLSAWKVQHLEQRQTKPATIF